MCFQDLSFIVSSTLQNTFSINWRFLHWSKFVNKSLISLDSFLNCVLNYFRLWVDLVLCNLSRSFSQNFVRFTFDNFWRQILVDCFTKGFSFLLVVLWGGGYRFGERRFSGFAVTTTCTKCSSTFFCFFYFYFRALCIFAWCSFSGASSSRSFLGFLLILFNLVIFWSSSRLGCSDNRFANLFLLFCSR